MPRDLDPVLRAGVLRKQRGRRHPPSPPSPSPPPHRSRTHAAHASAPHLRPFRHLLHPRRHTLHDRPHPALVVRPHEAVALAVAVRRARILQLALRTRQPVTTPAPPSAVPSSAVPTPHAPRAWTTVPAPAPPMRWGAAGRPHVAALGVPLAHVLWPVPSPRAPPRKRADGGRDTGDGVHCDVKVVVALRRRGCGPGRQAGEGSAPCTRCGWTPFPPSCSTRESAGRDARSRFEAVEACGKAMARPQAHVGQGPLRGEPQPL